LAIDAVAIKSRSSVLYNADWGSPLSQLRRRTESKRTWETNADVCCVSYKRARGQELFHIQRQIWLIEGEMVRQDVKDQAAKKTERKEGKECDGI
jgi:hypothetical protein